MTRKTNDADKLASIVLRSDIQQQQREVHITAMLWELGASHPVNGVRTFKGMNLWGIKIWGSMYSYGAEFLIGNNARYVGHIHMDENELAAALKAMKKVNAAMREHNPKTMGECLIAMADGLGAEFACYTEDRADGSYSNMKWVRSPFYREAQRIDAVVAAWVEQDRAERAKANANAEA